MFIFYIYSLPAATINSSILFIKNKLSVYIRENLTKYFHKEYLQGMTLYQITNLDRRVQDPGQIIANDVAKWSDSIALLYSNLTKPIFDIIIFTKALSNTMGFKPCLFMFSWYFFSSLLMDKISPFLAQQVALQQSNLLYNF
jgi:ABC-type uncharacterized transport system fused permease/ATPase subunit